ncbi:MAG: hypothetical protein NVSMB24_25920 [Mucilaginibacter sp.]
MAETLGSLCDKLTIVKLKQYHTEDAARLESLAVQERQLINEMNDFISNAFSGSIPLDRLSFTANKVFKKEGNEIKDIKGSIGEVFAELSQINCELWHEQEKVYEFEKVVPNDKNLVIKRLAKLNLERNVCIDIIDSNFKKIVTSRHSE